MQETQETWVQSLGQEDPPEKEMAPTPAFLPGESHEQRSLVGYGDWSDLANTHAAGGLQVCTSLRSLERRVEGAWDWGEFMGSGIRSPPIQGPAAYHVTLVESLKLTEC